MAAVNLAGGGAVPFLLELRREDVHLDHTATVAALLDTPVVMYLGAGTGGALGARGTPPVVLVAVAVDAFDGHTDLVVPDIESLVVVEVDGHVQSVRGEAEQLRHQLPRESDRTLLEIVADAEIAQHFEEGQVLVVPHLVDVCGAEALLAAGEAAGWRGLFSHEERLERHHSALVKSKVGSPAGIRDAEGMCWCPLLSKNWIKESLIWSPFMDCRSPIILLGNRMSSILFRHPMPVNGFHSSGQGLLIVDLGPASPFMVSAW